MMGPIGPFEILLIVGLALLVVGPQKLPGLARQTGRAMREFKNAASTATDELGLTEVVEDVNKLRSAGSDFGASMRSQLGLDQLGSLNLDDDSEKAVTAAPPVAAASQAATAAPPVAAASQAAPAAMPEAAATTPGGDPATPAAPEAKAARAAVPAAAPPVGTGTIVLREGSGRRADGPAAAEKDDARKSATAKKARTDQAGRRSRSAAAPAAPPVAPPDPAATPGHEPAP